jgi:uncharacterized membrane protein YphA (DoxX/SURF4 family)
MLGALFISGGARQLTTPDPLEQMAAPVTDRVAPMLRKAGLPLPTRTRDLVRLNGAVQVVAGMLLATGRMTRPAAAVLAGSLVPTTVAGHPFWRETDPARRRGEQIQFMTNLGVLGGLMLAAVDTEGRPSLGWRTRHLGTSIRRARRTARIGRPGAMSRKLPELVGRR